MYTTRQKRISVDEKRYKLKTVGLILLSIATVLVMYFYGLSLLAKFAGIAYEFKESGSEIETEDRIPPPPPKIDPLPKAVNKNLLTVSGTAEAESIVVININEQTQEIAVDSNGKFLASITLSPGQNYISAYSKDLQGNQSAKSSAISVVFDDEPPKIEITHPSNYNTLISSDQKNFTISGRTEKDVKLQINDRWVVINQDGAFTNTVLLNPGINTLTVKATDLAGNDNEISINVNYAP
jgi:hypothetical protein